MENLFKLVRGRDQSGDNSNNFHPISVAGGQYRGVDIFQRMGGSQDAQNVCIFHRKHKLKSAFELLYGGRSQCLIFKCFRFVLTSSKKEAMCSLISQYPKALIYWLNFEALGSTTKNHHAMARLNQSPFTFKRILSEVNHKIPFTIPLHGWGRG